MRYRLLAVLMLAAVPTLCVGQFEPLLSKLPAGGNTLLMVNAESMFASELATAGGWKKQYGEDFAEAPLLLPPDAQQFVLSSQLNPATMRPTWEAAAMTLSKDVLMPALARRVGGKQEQLGSVQAVATPKNAYVVKFEPSVFGLMIPGERQRTARWARESVSRKTPVLSPYLTTVAAYPDRAGTEIILAIDLNDAISRDAIQRAMEASPALASGGVDPAAATEVLASLDGMTLGVVVKAKATGSLRVDFSQPIATIKPVAKELLLEVLEQAGLAIDELYDWKLQTSEKGFRVTGPLGESGLRRLFSLIELDASGVAGADAVERPAAGGQVSASATKEHYDGVRRYLRDLKMESGAKSYGSIAYWFEKYADRIDRLPLLNVDPELLDYSATVVGQLRDCAGAIRGVGISTSGKSAGVQGQASSYGTTYNNSYNSNYNVFTGSTYEQGKDAIRDAAAQRQAIGRQERAKGSASVQEIVAQIKQETSAVRRTMTQKHGIEF